MSGAPYPPNIDALRERWPTCLSSIDQKITDFKNAIADAVLPDSAEINEYDVLMYNYLIIQVKELLDDSAQIGRLLQEADAALQAIKAHEETAVRKSQEAQALVTSLKDAANAMRANGTLLAETNKSLQAKITELEVSLEDKVNVRTSELRKELETLQIQCNNFQEKYDKDVAQAKEDGRQENEDNNQEIWTFARAEAAKTIREEIDEENKNRFHDLVQKFGERIQDLVIQGKRFEVAATRIENSENAVDSIHTGLEGFQSIFEETINIAAQQIEDATGIQSSALDKKTSALSEIVTHFRTLRDGLDDRLSTAQSAMKADKELREKLAAQLREGFKATRVNMSGLASEETIHQLKDKIDDMSSDMAKAEALVELETLIKALSHLRSS